MKALYALAGCLLMTVAAAAQRVPLERPINVVVTLEGEARLRGKLTAWDEAGFDLTDKDGQVHDVAWSRLPVTQAYQIQAGLLESADGRSWLALGLRLRDQEGGQPFAERAFNRAERIDPSLASRIARARKGEMVDVNEPDAPPPSKEGRTPPTVPPAGWGGELDQGVLHGPRIDAQRQADNWGPQPPEKTEATIARLKTFGEETRTKINSNLALFETDYFILYTDLLPEESRRWAADLDRMYHRLADLFGLPRGENIWLGKCLILIFRNELDYHRFNKVMRDVHSLGTAGMCHGLGSGEVIVVFYRNPDEMNFAYILVHEAVHGFLHRYRSPVHIPTWINEGLAEVISLEMVPKCKQVPLKQAEGKQKLKLLNHTGALFDSNRLEIWQYGVAASLTQFMIQQNKKGYVAFIKGIKDGMPWTDSLEQNYGVGLEKLVRVFGTTQEVANLRP